MPFSFKFIPTIAVAKYTISTSAPRPAHGGGVWVYEQLWWLYGGYMCSVGGYRVGIFAMLVGMCIVQVGICTVLVGI